MEKLEWFILVVILAIIGLLTASGIDYLSSSESLIGNGYVIEKHYYPPEHSTGVGYVGGAKGGATVITNNTTEESWTVIVKQGNDTFAASVDPNTWGSLKEGSEVTVTELRGFIWTWGKAVTPVFQSSGQ